MCVRPNLSRNECPAGSFWWRVAWDRCSSEVERRFFVDALLEAIRGESGAVALHAITPWAGDRLFPAAPASNEEREDSEAGHGGEARGAGDGHAAQLSLVTVNVNGLGGDYAEDPGQRMAAILSSCLAVKPAPDALLF